MNINDEAWQKAIDNDHEMAKLYLQDQRKLYAGPAKYDCPDCGRKNVITEEMKRRGYHCDYCTASMEGGDC